MKIKSNESLKYLRKGKKNFKSVLIIKWMWTFRNGFWRLFECLGMKQLDYGCQLPGVTQLFLLIFIVLLIEIEFSPHEIILFLFEFYWFLIYACWDMRLANDRYWNGWNKMHVIVWCIRKHTLDACLRPQTEPTKASQSWNCWEVHWSVRCP